MSILESILAKVFGGDEEPASGGSSAVTGRKSAGGGEESPGKQAIQGRRLIRDGGQNPGSAMQGDMAKMLPFMGTTSMPMSGFAKHMGEQGRRRALNSQGFAASMKALGMDLTPDFLTEKPKGRAPARSRGGSIMGPSNATMSRQRESADREVAFKDRERQANADAARERSMMQYKQDLAKRLLGDALGGGGGGTNRTTETTQQIFDYGGQPRLVPITTTREETLSNAQRAQMLQQILQSL